MNRHLLLLLCFSLSLFASKTWAEEDDDESFQEDRPTIEEAQPPPSRSDRERERERDRKRKRKYHVVDPDRVDAGIFHVAFAVGGNFYTEPKYDTVTKAPNGDYFKDFGFQGGAYFDYDYSALTENVPLGVRGFIGYKYILNSVNVFAFDGLLRRMWQMSDNASFGVGIGASFAIWYRSQTSETNGEETIFLPSAIIGAGFEFTPFMVDAKWVINRFGSDTTITGLELYFGFRI